MSIEQARTCKECQRENLQGAKFCRQCGADLAAPSRRPLLIAVIAAGLTPAPFIITPILLVSSIDPMEAAMYFGAPYITAFLLITFLMAVYLGVGAIIGAVIRRKNPSAARGVLVGVWVGLLLGVVSCTASFRHVLVEEPPPRNSSPIRRERSVQLNSRSDGFERCFHSHTHGWMFRRLNRFHSDGAESQLCYHDRYAHSHPSAYAHGYANCHPDSHV